MVQLFGIRLIASGTLKYIYHVTAIISASIETPFSVYLQKPVQCWQKRQSEDIL